MPESIVAIVNPQAGGGSCGKKANAILQSLRAGGFDIEPHFTQGPQNASVITQQLWNTGKRKFVVLGGDGTVFEVLNGIFPDALQKHLQEKDKPTLAIIPLGTGNSFLRDLDILNCQDAIAAMKKGVTRQVDIVEINHAEGQMFYLNILGMGFTAQAGDLTNRKFKALGSAGYILAALMSLIKMNHSLVTCTLDEKSISTVPSAMISFCNSQFTAGALRMAPDAMPWDGKLDMVRVGPLSRFGLLKSIPKTLTGTHIRHPEIESFQAQRIQFENPIKQPIMVDGEILDLEIHSLQVVPAAIDIFSLEPA